MKKKLNSLKRCVRTSHELAELKQQKSKRLILGLLRSTLTLWQCAAKVILAFLIFAVLVLLCKFMTAVFTHLFNFKLLRVICFHIPGVYFKVPRVRSLLVKKYEEPCLVLNRRFFFALIKCARASFQTNDQS